MTEELIDINDAGFKAYVAVPSAGKGHGILLLHSRFGIQQYMIDQAHLYAAAGYTAFVPNVYWRLSPNFYSGLEYNDTDFVESGRLATSVDRQLVVEDLQLAIAKLRQLPQCKEKIGVVGYCSGARYAYLLAAKNAADAYVGYYGKLVPYLDDAAKIEQPVLLHFGTNDRAIPLADMNKILDAHRDHKYVQSYSDYLAGHGFDDHGFPSDLWPGTGYHRQSSLLAFGRSMIFLNNVMPPE